MLPFMQQINNVKKIRHYLLYLINDLTEVQLNEIPANHNNNIIWHIGHLIVTHYSICYRPTGNKVPLDDNFYTTYKPGGKPNGLLEDKEIERYKQMLISKVDEFEVDYQANYFKQYNSWTTPYGVEITNIEEAMNFVIFHEGLHIGYIMALKKLV
jgi:hypothetical protein